MASAILPSRNDPRSSDFMNRFTDNRNHDFTRLQNFTNRNPNPNPNPSLSQFFNGNPGRDVIWRNQQQLPSSAPPEAAFAGSSINSVPANYRFITFRLDSYTRRELKAFKKRLMSDLERVRMVRQLVCSMPMPKTNQHAQQLGLPKAPAPEVCLTVKERQKSAIGQKRAKPLPVVRDTKKQCGGRVTNAQRRKLMMRECGQILGKLMKHKHGWVFNTPVDAAALKLYDYHNVISNPMDLGTIKSKLVKNEYESPVAFASDVRLTFQNAMLYNGKGSDVFAMAERLLLLFEDMFNSTHSKFVVNQAKKQNRSVSVPVSVEKPVLNKTFVVEKPVMETAAVVQPSAVNSGKPMIRVASKPEMTAEEKSELAASFCDLQLGPEGMNQIMAIVKKGKGFEHEGDEIELDLAVLDNETLWELHSFIGCTLRNSAATACNVKGVVTDLLSSVQVENLVDEQGRKRDAGEEDVDIGDEMQLTSFPSLEIEKDVASSSDSSSGSDSSSSDSGSGTCSGDSYNEQEVNSTPKGLVP